MNQISPEELIRHASSKQCSQCDTVYDKKNRKVRHHDHETECNLQLQHPRGRALVKDLKQRKNAKKGKFADTATQNNYSRKLSKKRNYDGEDKISKYSMGEDDFMDTCNIS